MSKQLTLDLLKFVHMHLQQFQKMGIVVKIEKISAANLRDRRIVDVMIARGITNLPAALIPGLPAVIGVNAIKDFYTRNIENNAFAVRAEKAAPILIDPDEDIFRSYYGAEMTLERAAADTEETQIGGSGEDNMVTAAHKFQQKRDAAAARRAASQPLPPQRGPQSRPQPQPRSQSQPRPPSPPQPQRQPQRDVDPADDDFDQVFAKLAGDINTSGLHERAFSAPPGDADGDDEHNAQDDLILGAYYTNLTQS